MTRDAWLFAATVLVMPSMFGIIIWLVLDRLNR